MTPAHSPQSQIDLFDARLHSRWDSPGTSKNTAYSIKEVVDRHYELILGILRQSPKPLSPEQISIALGGRLSPHEIGKRMADLRRGQKVIRSGTKHKNKSGKWAEQYVIAPISGSQQ